MPLPPLITWDETRIALHQTLTVLLMARLVGLEPLPNGLRHSLKPIPEGVSTGLLNFGGELQFHYATAALHYQQGGEVAAVFDVRQFNQQSLAQAVFEAIARRGHDLYPDYSKVSAETAFTPDLNAALEYVTVQWAMFRTLSHLKSMLIGPQSPLVVWAHGFDLSSLWFVDGMDEHNDPHINFGFSPGTPDVGQPYVYFYIYPALDALQNDLPELITWHSAWSTPGGIIPYDRFSQSDDPETLVVDTLYEVYETASKLLRA